MGQTTAQLKSDIQQQRSALGNDLDALGDRLSPRRMAQRRKTAIANTVQSMRERVMGTAQDAGAATSQLASDAAQRVAEAPDAARRQVDGNPLAAGVLAFAAGLVVAALIPETEPERDVARRVQPAMEQMAGEVGQAAQESMEHLRPAAHEAAEHVRDQAQEAASSVKDQAQQSGQQPRDQV